MREALNEPGLISDVWRLVKGSARRDLTSLMRRDGSTCGRSSRMEKQTDQQLFLR